MTTETRSIHDELRARGLPSHHDAEARAMAIRTEAIAAMIAAAGRFARRLFQAATARGGRMERTAVFVTMSQAPVADDDVERAIEELSTYSDRDLADLGIARGNIRDAVLNGRPGIDRPHAVNDDRPRSDRRNSVA